MNASHLTEVITSARVNDDAEWVSGTYLSVDLPLDSCPRTLGIPGLGMSVTFVQHCH